MGGGDLTRERVYKLIDGERDYQDHLPRNDVKEQRPMEQLALIETICERARAAWYDHPGQLDMAFMRKIAGVAVRCMEDHGAPER
jgi:hypothetical protein